MSDEREVQLETQRNEARSERDTALEALAVIASVVVPKSGTACRRTLERVKAYAASTRHPEDVGVGE